ncbi:MAG: hypothetical protein MJY71_02585 [Bacteroidaceae bacterium]|nr:hypothetical protein [Bacteroidaceae bacterium]
MIAICNQQRDEAVRYLTAYAEALQADRSDRGINARRLARRLARQLAAKQPLKK